MVERRQATRRPRPRVGVAVPDLPPVWGAGVAPPSTPHYSLHTTPDTSPGLATVQPQQPAVQLMQTSPDSEAGSRDSRGSRHSEPCPATGAELLRDLHTRLMVHSVAGTLPRHPGLLRPGHRQRDSRKSRARHERHAASQQRDNCVTVAGPAYPPPDLLPSSAFNHPSRHTQYSVTARGRGSHTPSPPPPASQSPPLASTSLSYPSPPLLRPRPAHQPLTSTMLGSPDSASLPSSASTTNYHTHHNSPASPELSSIPRRPLDATRYQNVEAGIAYISSADLATAPGHGAASATNLSRFNVSPPSSAVLQPVSRPGPSRSHSRNKLKGKTVSWVADRKVNAKYISDDRKIVKNQVHIAVSVD